MHSVRKRQPFGFRVIPRDMEKFAEQLILLVQVFDFGSAEDKDVDFHIEGSKFYADNYHNRFDISTYGLFDVADRHLLMHNHYIEQLISHD